MFTLSSGLEALLRWNNAKLGAVSPAKFIPIAEEAGLINSIGEWVLRTACLQMAAWHQLGMRKLLISVNISAKQFNQDGLVKTIESVLIETNAKAENIELELTESLLISDTSKTYKTLRAIKSLGIQLSIDDFGTGFSSLAYLNTMPIDTLKIDKAFTDTIVANTKKAPIVDNIISLAKNLNLKIVAEGVESSDQVDYLKKQGCNQIQGFYFHKPLPANEIEELLIPGRKLGLPELKLVKTPRKKISKQ